MQLCAQGFEYAHTSYIVNLVFYDFFRGQLRPRVQNRKQLFLLLLFCVAALMLVNSLGSSLVNLIFGMSVLIAQVLHGLQTCFLDMRYTMREHFPLSFLFCPFQWH